MWKMTVRLNADLAERLKQRVDKERRSLQTVVTVAIEQYLKTAKGGESR